MKKSKKRGISVPTYEDVDPITGEEIVKHKKKYFARYGHSKPETKEIKPITPLQEMALAAIGKKMFANQPEFERFCALEKKFTAEHHKVEAAVWKMWMERMIAWGRKREIKTVSAICTAIENKESWGRFWNENKFKVSAALRSTKVSQTDLVAAYEGQDTKW